MDVPCFQINLDLAPEERYLAVFVNYQDNIKIIYEKFLASIPIKRREFFKILAEVIKKFDNDYYKEIECLSQIIEMDIGDCFAVDYVCEATTGCTSIISRMIDRDGNSFMVHGRNLDYPVEVELMKKSTYKAIFTKGGKELCTAIVFAGFQGIYTGIKKGGFSISYNLRMKSEENGFFKNMVLAFLGYKKWSNIIKDTFINCNTFAEAISYIQETPAVNPCYLTICGIDRGAKLTLDRFKSRVDWVYLEDAQLLENEELKDMEEVESKTFDVQTNFDTTEEPPERDNGRYEAATKALKLISPALMTEQRMIYSILNVFPVNNEETVYCSFMNPATYKCSIIFPDPDK